MNAYITFDGKKYGTLVMSWQPVLIKPTQVRYNLDGTTDTTFGPAVPNEWSGHLVAKMTPDSGYGDIDDLRASLAKTEVLTMIDHYGDTYSVVSLGIIVPESKSPMWDAATNEFKVFVKLVRVYA